MNLHTDSRRPEAHAREQASSLLIMFDATTLLLGLVFGSIGLGYFIYGKQQQNLVARYTGIALMAYPYLIDNKWAIVGIGVLLMLLPTVIEL